MSQEVQDFAADNEFQRLIVDAQSDLFSFIALMAGNTADARDLLQETNLALLKKSAQYDRDRPFRAWARSIAYYEVLTFRQKHRRERLIFNDELFDRLSAKVMEEDTDEEILALRHESLKRCLAKLTHNQSTIIELRYKQDVSISKLAKRMACTEAAVSTLLYRIRRVLGECIRFEIAKETVL
ncbi:MAG: sigma-70 family RNA polymerase sigma factor [Kiritimatiellae bacterium]|nr:sigma-70 family RNA polymerase sigma factor [Kiritimatiellia bacterium]